MLRGRFFSSLPGTRVSREGLARLEMSAVRPPSCGVAGQTACGLSAGSALCSVPRRRKTRKKRQNGSVALKRKWSEVLEPGSSDSPLEGGGKRTRTLNTNESECEGPHSLSDVDSGFSSEASPPTSGRCSPCAGVQPSMLLAMDCEMVGTGPNGQFSELARCSLVSYSGIVVYDKYVLPCRPVTNYRTRWSGIKKEHLINALPYEEARNEILQIIEGKVIIGHALHHDFAVLRTRLPQHQVRDTSYSPLLRRLYGASTHCVSLKKLTRSLLNRSIQVDGAGHCSAEDALAALDLYKLVEEEWEKSLHAQPREPGAVSEPAFPLERYMQDEYWPESLNDCSQ